MIKKLLLGSGLFVIILATALWIIARDTPATNAGLNSANLPPLIPTRSFFADPRSAFGYDVSPDGRYVSYLQASQTGRKIAIRDLHKDKVIAELPSGLTGRRWSPDSSRLRFILEGHRWEMDPLSPARKNWRQISPQKLSGGWVIFRFPNTSNGKTLIAGRTGQRTLTNLYLASQDGKNIEEIAKGTKETQFWAIDRDMTPVLRFDAKDPFTWRLMRKNGEEWVSLTDLDLNDTFLPVSWVQKDGSVLARSSRGRDKVALVSFDTQTGHETVILENPKADIGLAYQLTDDWEVDFVDMSLFSPMRRALTERGQVFLDVLSEFKQPVGLGYIGRSAGGRFVTAAISPGLKSWVYVLIDLEQKTHTMLGEYHFRRFADDLSFPNPVMVPARDRLELPSILTLPQGVSGPIPFVVLIHGGPADIVNQRYNHDVQFLVNRGYGVLEVNFRGSVGFGKAFQAAGFRAFGRAMQDDIADAGRWLIDQGLADPDALAVMGTSYGGYAAAMAMTRDPGLFDAAVVKYPMLDVEFQSRYHPEFWNAALNTWWRYFGQPDNNDDLAFMRTYSPSNRIDQLHGPILMIVGLKDQITAPQQARDFEKSAKNAGKQITAHYLDDVGHGARRWRDMLAESRLTEDFLARELGGRSGGFELIELAPPFFD